MTGEQHIAVLCRMHGIRATVAEGRGRARVKERLIRHPPIRTEMAYFVALHEIGHIVVGLEGTRLEREAAAWDWALEHALAPPHYSTRQRICACLIRYLARAQASDWPTPPPRHRFWALLAWWSAGGG